MHTVGQTQMRPLGQDQVAAVFHLGLKIVPEGTAQDPGIILHHAR